MGGGPYAGGPYVGFCGSSDDFEELVDSFELPPDDAPDRFALEVDDIADNFRKAARTSLNGATRARMSLPEGGACKSQPRKREREIISDKNDENIFCA